MTKSNPCSKCGCPDIKKYKRKDRKKLSSFCILCHKEDQADRDAKIYKWKLKYNQEWRKKNREKVNGYARKDYLKRKDKINARRRELYVPKKRTGKKPQPWKYVKTRWAPLDYRKVKDDTYKF